MKRLKNPKALLVLIAFLLLAGGASFFLLANKDSLNFSSSRNNEASDTPQPVDSDEPTPTGQGIHTPKFDEELPEGTVSPHTVASDANKFFGKQLQVRGLIVEASSGKYSITSQKADESLGLRLKLASDIDIKPHLNSGYESQGAVRLADPVTVTGKLLNPNQGQVLTLKVESIN